MEIKNDSLVSQLQSIVDASNAYHQKLADTLKNLQNHSDAIFRAVDSSLAPLVKLQEEWDLSSLFKRLKDESSFSKTMLAQYNVLSSELQLSCLAGKFPAIDTMFFERIRKQQAFLNDAIPHNLVKDIDNFRDFMVESVFPHVSVDSVYSAEQIKEILMKDPSEYFDCKAESKEIRSPECALPPISENEMLQIYRFVWYLLGRIGIMCKKEEWQGVLFILTLLMAFRDPVQPINHSLTNISYLEESLAIVFQTTPESTLPYEIPSVEKNNEPCREREVGQDEGRRVQPEEKASGLYYDEEPPKACGEPDRRNEKDPEQIKS